MSRSNVRGILGLARAIAIAVTLAGVATAQLRFDLADAARGGDGSFPGTGTSDEYAMNPARVFLAQPTWPFVDGVFVPLDSGPTVIDSTGGTLDVAARIGGPGTNGGPGNGAVGINDPSGVGGGPDYTGDPANHSLLACHASVGITYDLDAIRATYPGFSIDRFTANVGNSCSGPINYFVVADGTPLASHGGLQGGAFTPLDVALPAGTRFFTLAIGDNNTGSINCAHGYWGDPHLHLTLGQGQCSSTLNSTGQAARISASGSTSVSASDLVLLATPVPRLVNALFFYGPSASPGFTPFGNGLLCVAGNLQFLPFERSTVSGVLAHRVDLTSPPSPGGTVTPGSTWIFQAVFRDPLGGGAFFNVSDALKVIFSP